MRRLLVISNMYPSADNESFGVFVGRQVSAFESLGVECDLAVSTERIGSVAAAALKYGRLATRALARAGGHPEAVVGHYAFPTGAIAIAAARRARVPVAVVVHGTDVSSGVDRAPGVRSATRAVLRRADLVVSVSESLKRDAIAAGAGESRAIVASMGYDEKLFRPGSRDEARSALGLDAEETLAVFVGGLTEAKGLATLIEAAGRLRESHPRLRWILVGPGDRARWQNAAEKAGAQEVVRLIGPRPSEEIPRWLAAADFALLPSLRESFGVAAVEAMACGVPVVAARTGGIAETVRDGVTGLLVPPGDPSALAAAVARIASDEDLRTRLGAAGPEAAAPHGSLRQAGILLGALDALCAGRIA